MHACANCGHESAEEFDFCPKCGTRRVEGARGLIGSTLNGKYRVNSAIGEGAMGSVYLAEHVSLGKRFALKLLHRDLQLSEEGLQRFQREGIAAGQVTHPNAIQIFDFDRTQDGRFFLAMEYVEGPNLKQVLEEGPLPTDTALNLGCQLLSALVEAHTNGIIHRDLKPENLMVISGAAGEKTLKVLDFGLSKLVDRPMSQSLATQPGRVMGTPMYMAPEQWQGREADTRTDLYASSAILFEMVSGRPPFEGRDIADSMLKATTQNAPAIREVAPEMRLPRGLDDLLAIGLARDPEERFQTAGEMLAELRELATGATTTSVRRRPGGRGPTRPSRLPVVAGIAVGAGLLALALWFALGSGGEGDRSSTSDSQTVTAASLVRDKEEGERSMEERSYLRLLDSARSALARGDERLAMGTVGDALRMECVDAEGYLVRAAVFLASDDRETARADLREALDRHPAYAMAQARLGWLSLDEGDMDSAAEEFQAALSLDASCGEAVAGTAALLLSQDKTTQAREAVLGAPDVAQRHPLSQLQLGHAALADGDITTAIDAFVASKRGDADLWQAYAGLADAYLANGQTKDAEREFRAALERCAAESAENLRTRLATLLVNDERTDEAATLLGSAQREDSVERTRLHGLIALAADDLTAARRHLESVVRSQETDARSLLLLGQVCLLQEDWTAAEENLARCCENDDRNGRAHFSWAMALLRLGQHKRAAARFKRAAELDPDDAQAHLNSGILHRDYLGNNEAALEAFRAYQRVGGSDPRVDEWIRALGG